MMNKKRKETASDSISARLLKGTENFPDLTGSFSSLPGEIFMEILCRIPISTLCSLRFVCKAWFLFIHDPRLAKLHLITSNANKEFSKFVIYLTLSRHIRIIDHRIFDEEINIARAYHACFRNAVRTFMERNSFRIDTCNGLVFTQRPFHITNPITGEYILLPTPGMLKPYEIATGFGFDWVSNEYKVIRVLENEYMCGFGTVLQIHTVGWRGWKLIDNVPCRIRSMSSCSSAFMNGAFHWIAIKDTKSMIPDVIMSFDIHTGKFGEIPLPSDTMIHEETWQYLMVLGESLSLVEEESDEFIMISVMKEYGVESSWELLCTIDATIHHSDSEEGDDDYPHGPFVPLQLMKNGEILMFVERRHLCYYDPKTDHFRRSIEIQGMGPRIHFFEPIVHAGSLISPECIGTTNCDEDNSVQEEDDYNSDFDNDDNEDDNDDDYVRTMRMGIVARLKFRVTGIRAVNRHW